MAIVQCSRGHYYDDAKHSACPICTGGTLRAGIGSEALTVSLESLQPKPELTNIHLNLQPEQNVPPPPAHAGIRAAYDDQKTVSLPGDDSSEWFTGWLVCVKGPTRGMDYRLYPGFNRIGKALRADLCLQDPSIADENHAAVVYDRKSRQFFLVPGPGSITFLNGLPAGGPLPLEEGARIGMGDSELILIPFCKGDRSWK